MKGLFLGFNPINKQVMQHLLFAQVLPISTEEAWDFFSNPHNLQKITPPALNFRIMNSLPEKVYEGLFIEYRISPLFNINMEWVTEITQVKAPYYFVDEQRKGPYQIWHHEHHFESVSNGVKMTDKLYYSLPFGILGRIVDKTIVHNNVLNIFEYRRNVLENIFGK